MVAKPPKEPTLLEKLEKAMLQQKVEAYTRESYTWLQKEARKLAGPSLRTRIVKEEKAKGRALRGDPSKIHLGSMIMYQYSAKHKETLPYWDAFPVIFLISVDGDSFDGINLHYISPKYRAIILDQLLSVMNNWKFDDTTKLKLTYAILKRASKMKLLLPCYKKYLISHVKSKMIKIHPKDWQTILFLPLQNFQKAPASTVWGDSVIKSTKKPKP